MSHRGQHEEGQVTPALLIAVIGGFAIAVAFVSLQLLVDQTGRADTASDAAALAAGDELGDDLFDFLEGNSGLHLGQIAQLLADPGSFGPDLEEAARNYANANGATVLGDVDPLGSGFGPDGSYEWRYEVTTKQQDTVEGGSSEIETESTSRVAVSNAELCAPVDSEIGLLTDEGCVGFGALKAICDYVPPPPSPSPTPSGTETPTPAPTPTPTPTPTPSPPPLFGTLPCFGAGDIAAELDGDFEVRLISSS